MPEIQASNFVYPDGSFGPAGYKKYIKRLGPDNYQLNPSPSPDELSLGEYINSPDEIAWFSCKYGDICSRLAFKPEHLRKDDSGETIPD